MPEHEKRELDIEAFEVTELEDEDLENVSGGDNTGCPGGISPNTGCPGGIGDNTGCPGGMEM